MQNEVCVLQNNLVLVVEKSAPFSAMFFQDLLKMALVCSTAFTSNKITFFRDFRRHYFEFVVVDIAHFYSVYWYIHHHR